jgi:hypothetical protein
VAFHIVDFIKAFVIEVGHANFLALENKNRTPHGKAHKRKHFSAPLPVFGRGAVQ